MLGPTKPFPRVGDGARIAHFGGRSEPVTIVGVEDDGRRLVVCDLAGVRREFTLRRATAAFVEAGQQHAPRLRLTKGEIAVGGGRAVDFRTSRSSSSQTIPSDPPLQE